MANPGAGTENFQLFFEGDELYAHMLSAISSAEHSIKVESYIFADDEVGQQFSSALIARARAGVRVRVHIDAAGSFFRFSRRMQSDFRRDGVQLRWFHRLNWRQPWRYNRRNHRKLLIVDDRLAYLGGFNIHIENSRECYGESRWRDTHVSFGGSLVKVASQLFDAFWRAHLNWSPQREYGGSLLLHNHTLRCRHRLRCVYAEAFRRARQYIYLTTPYFVPDSHTLGEIRQAAGRGVDVRLLVPRKSDMRMARWAAQHVYASLLVSGVRIYEYLPRMLHAKTVVVDGGWSMVGTANLDYRSLFINYELNLITANEELSSAFKEQFLRDLSLAEQIKPDAWSRRKWIARWQEQTAIVIRRWL